MNTYTVYIKQMCCRRCIEAVDDILVSLKLTPKETVLGRATFEGRSYPIEQLHTQLKARGFDVVASEDELLTTTIKATIIELIHTSEKESSNGKEIRSFLENKTLKSFRFMNTVFVRCEGVTINRYIILQRIERVKMLIEENQLNFSEIADSTGYNTLQHLSGQFRKETGMSMQQYKTEKTPPRTPLDKV